MPQTSTFYPAGTAPAATLAPRRVSQWLLFFAIAAMLLAASWNVISAAGFEMGDFAANSLLIQDAKSLALFKGNYSRVGFNHPGPAILYVLAAGEVLLYDWLHLATTPFAGQLMAIAFYTAFWLTMMYRILGRITGSGLQALLALAVFALAASLLDFQVFTGAWFPHLYFFPFAVMLLAASRLVDGRTDALPTLALACGFLINGHVSFIAILGIIFLTVAAGNFLMVRRGRIEGPAMLTPAFYRMHRQALHRFALILAIFLLPLLIETLRHFPGPLAEYAAFSGQTKLNTLIQAITYTGVYWGGTGFAGVLAAAFAGMLLLYAGALKSPFGSALRALVVVFVGATLALVFYAKVGIDLLEYAYIGLFYYTVPALAVMAAAAALAHAPWGREQRLLQAALAIVCLVIVVRSTHKPVDYQPQYSQPGVPELFETLKAIPHQGRMVLELDNGKDPGFVWSSMLGLQAYAKRRHEDFFCIHSNWHISNTKAARCTDDEVARQPRYRVWQAAPTDGPGLAHGMGLAVERLVAPDMSAMGEVTVKSQPALFQKYILGGGWSTVEPEIVWTLGKQSTLALHVTPGFIGDLTLELEAFLPKPDATQLVKISTPGAVAANVNFTQAINRQRVSVPVKADANGLVQIDLQTDHPISPKSAGLSPDSRVLGVALRAFLIQAK